MRVMAAVPVPVRESGMVSGRIALVGEGGAGEDDRKRSGESENQDGDTTCWGQFDSSSALGGRPQASTGARPRL